MFNLKWCKFVALKKNTVNLFKINIVSTPKTLFRVFLMGTSGFLFMGGTLGGEWDGAFFQVQNIKLLASAGYNQPPPTRN